MKRLLAIFRGLPGWVALAVVVVAALAFGSVHPPASSDAARISQLDSIIRCPSCDDLSIAQSDASTAVALRAIVASDVRAGESNAAIENYVVGRYGSSILLSPTQSIVWVLPLVLGAVAVGAFGYVMWRRRRRRVATAADEQLVAAALGGLDDIGRATPGAPTEAELVHASGDGGAAGG